MTWAELFDHGRTTDVDLETIQDTLETHRNAADTDSVGDDRERADAGENDARSGSVGSSSNQSARSDQPNPARVVADADVLVADVLVDDAARDALDHVRRHSWVELVASDELLADTERLLSTLSDGEFAAAHRRRLEADRIRAEQPAGDHPALASAYQGNAAHLLSYDDRLGSAKAGLTLQPRLSLSIRPPDAFATLFNPESLYAAISDDEYPGPDRDPRA